MSRSKRTVKPSKRRRMKGRRREGRKAAYIWQGTISSPGTSGEEWGRFPNRRPHKLLSIANRFNWIQATRCALPMLPSQHPAQGTLIATPEGRSPRSQNIHRLRRCGEREKRHGSYGGSLCPETV